MVCARVGRLVSSMIAVGSLGEQALDQGDDQK
jgi:hypothetical protein